MRRGVGHQRTGTGTNFFGLELLTGLVLRESDGSVLLVQRAGVRARWDLPGDQVDWGESPTDAAIRGALEQLGVVVELDALVGLYHLRHIPGGRRIRHSAVRYVFAARILDGPPVLGPNAGLTRIDGFGLDALPAPLSLTAPLALEDAAAGRTGVLRELVG